MSETHFSVRPGEGRAPGRPGRIRAVTYKSMHEGKSQFRLHHLKEQPLISLVTNFHQDRMEISISPRVQNQVYDFHY